MSETGLREKKEKKKKNSSNMTDTGLRKERKKKRKEFLKPVSDILIKSGIS
jgi:hypothetical protein